MHVLHHFEQVLLMMLAGTESLAISNQKKAIVGTRQLSIL